MHTLASPRNHGELRGTSASMLPSPYLHHGVIDRDEGGEQVQIAGCEDEGKKNLTLPRDTCVAGRRKEGKADERKDP